jgi:hypothetical protein
LTEEQKNESMTIQEKAKGKIRWSLLQCNCKRLLPYLWQSTDGSILVDIETAICFPCGRSSCPVIYNITARGDQSTSLANLFTQKNELPHLFCKWEEEKCEKFDGGSVHFRVLKNYHTKERFD